MLTCSTNGDCFLESISSFKTSLATEGDFHISSMVVIPLVGKDGSTYNVRALLDSGSGSNFICKDILPHLDYEYLATKQMKVTGINTTENRTYDLVNVSIANTDCPVKKFKCYTLPNIVKYQVDKKFTMHSCQTV